MFEYHNVLSNWNRLRDRQFAVADALEDVNTSPQQTQEVVQTFLLAQSYGPTRACLGWDTHTHTQQEASRMGLVHQPPHTNPIQGANYLFDFFKKITEIFKKDLRFIMEISETATFFLVNFLTFAFF